MAQLSGMPRMDFGGDMTASVDALSARHPSHRYAFRSYGAKAEFDGRQDDIRALFFFEEDIHPVGEPMEIVKQICVIVESYTH
ncbi:hypothetical protein ACVFYP_21955 [Roseomonas sp. F4]